jgi:hypothetical protein
MTPAAMRLALLALLHSWLLRVFGLLVSGQSSRVCVFFVAV